MFKISLQSANLLRKLNQKQKMKFHDNFAIKIATKILEITGLNDNMKIPVDLQVEHSRSIYLKTKAQQGCNARQSRTFGTPRDTEANCFRVCHGQKKKMNDLEF